VVANLAKNAVLVTIAPLVNAALIVRVVRIVRIVSDAQIAKIVKIVLIAKDVKV